MKSTLLKVITPLNKINFKLLQNFCEVFLNIAAHGIGGLYIVIVAFYADDKNESWIFDGEVLQTPTEMLLQAPDPSTEDLCFYESEIAGLRANAIMPRIPETESSMSENGIPAQTAVSPTQEILISESICKTTGKNLKYRHILRSTKINYDNSRAKFFDNT